MLRVDRSKQDAGSGPRLREWGHAGSGGPAGARATPTTQTRKPRKLFFSKRCYCIACLLSSR